MKARNLGALIGAGYGGLSAYSILVNWSAEFSLWGAPASGYDNWFDKFAGEYLTILDLPLGIAWSLSEKIGLDNFLFDVGRAYTDIMYLITSNDKLNVALGGAIAGAVVGGLVGLMFDLVAKRRKKKAERASSEASE